MYRPWSFRAARRAADNRSLRPLRDGFEESRVAASRASVSRAKARAIEPNDLRITWTSLLIDLRRGLCKRASKADATGESYYGTAGSGAGSVVAQGLTTFQGVPLATSPSLVPRWYPD
jgi:hypothetical protein